MVVGDRRDGEAVSGARAGADPRIGVRRRTPATGLRGRLCVRVRVYAGHRHGAFGADPCRAQPAFRGLLAGRSVMNIGVIRERGPYDRRVALTPPVVRRLASAGHTVWVESGA